MAGRSSPGVVVGLAVAEYELDENNRPHFRAKAGSFLCVNARIGRSDRTQTAGTGMNRKQYAPRITNWAMTAFVNTSTRRSKSRTRDDSWSLIFFDPRSHYSGRPRYGHSIRDDARQDAVFLPTNASRNRAATKDFPFQNARFRRFGSRLRSATICSREELTVLSRFNVPNPAF